jgi:hypothetical protein
MMRTMVAAPPHSDGSLSGELSTTDPFVFDSAPFAVPRALSRRTRSK